MAVVVVVVVKAEAEARAEVGGGWVRDGGRVWKPVKRIQSQ